MTRHRQAIRRAELHPVIVRMRDEDGVSMLEIARRFGISRSMAYDYYHDPTGEKARARKAKSDGVCVDCGGRTVGDGGHAPERCWRCAMNHQSWTNEALIDAIQLWAERYGEHPSALEWNPSMARASGLEWMAERFEAGGWPSLRSVQRAFGSWNAGIEAAGFEPRPVGVRGAAWYRPADLLLEGGADQDG